MVCVGGRDRDSAPGKTGSGQPGPLACAGLCLALLLRFRFGSTDFLQNVRDASGDWAVTRTSQAWSEG